MEDEHRSDQLRSPVTAFSLGGLRHKVEVSDASRRGHRNAEP
jgi:hypothetical protein